MEIRRRIFKTGNSVCITIPFRVMKELNLEKGDLVDVDIKKSEK